jgi:hypothetical protein
VRSISDLSVRRDIVTRSISAENPTGRAGGGARAVDGFGAEAARDLGKGWKVAPAVSIEPGETFVVADISGPGKITHIWMTSHHSTWRTLVLRAYWEGDAEPAVETPLGDFFAQGTGIPANVNSLPVSVNPLGGLNCYWPMPFTDAARITVENLGSHAVTFFYQVTFEEGPSEGDHHYFHAQWRRTNPVPYLDTHLMLEGIEGAGQYVGTYMSWGSHTNGWWGEGELKFYMDDDDEHPTICGTGTEDYFGGAWGFLSNDTVDYETYSTPFLGMPQVTRPGDGVWGTQTRISLYRWHVADPIHFRDRLSRVDVQALGWRSEGRYLPLQDDVASTVFFYLDRTHTTRPPTPDADAMELLLPMPRGLQTLLNDLPPHAIRRLLSD